MRWLLVGDAGVDEQDDDVPVARCTEIDGLFVDLPPRERERFTLVGCEAAGRLAEPHRWLSRVSVLSSGWPAADLVDLVVLGSRPSSAVPGAVDIELDGVVHTNDRADAVPRPRDAEGFVLAGWGGEALGRCREVLGVWRDQGPPPVPRVRLAGCRAEAPLLSAIEAIGRLPHGGRDRRRIRAAVHQIARDGSETSVVGATVCGSVEEVHPSRLGDGLLDVVVASDPIDPLPAGVLGILDRWRDGRPAERNLWAGYNRELREQWAGVALAHRVIGPDRPPGTTYHLDGRFVTGIEGFWCAIGEAINGPGGYFGWNHGALHDCLRGNFGALAPFRLVWHDSAVARKHLVAGYDGRIHMPALTLDDLHDLFTSRGVTVQRD